MISTKRQADGGKRLERRWTYEEFRADWPETNLTVELWDGEPVMSINSPAAGAAMKRPPPGCSKGSK